MLLLYDVKKYRNETSNIMKKTLTDTLQIKQYTAIFDRKQYSSVIFVWYSFKITTTVFLWMSTLCKHNCVLKAL